MRSLTPNLLGNLTSNIILQKPERTVGGWSVLFLEDPVSFSMTLYDAFSNGLDHNFPKLPINDALRRCRRLRFLI